MSRKTNQELTLGKNIKSNKRSSSVLKAVFLLRLVPSELAKKLSKLRKQQNWKLFWKMGSLIVIFGAALLFIIYLISPLSHIQSLKVSGNQPCRTEVYYQVRV